MFGHTTEESWPYTSGSTTETGDCTFDMEVVFALSWAFLHRIFHFHLIVIFYDRCLQATAPAVTLAGYDTLPPNDQVGPDCDCDNPEEEL